MEFIKSIYKVSDEVVFGKEFKVLKEIPKIYEKRMSMNIYIYVKVKLYIVKL